MYYYAIGIDFSLCTKHLKAFHNKKLKNKS